MVQMGVGDQNSPKDFSENMRPIGLRCLARQGETGKRPSLDHILVVIRFSLTALKCPDDSCKQGASIDGDEGV